MKILSIDPSAISMGWAFLKDGEIIDVGFIPPLEGVNHGARYGEAWLWLKKMIQIYKPDLLLFEDYFFASKFAAGASVSVELRGVLKLCAFNHAIDYTMIDPAKWKRILLYSVVDKLTGKEYTRVKSDKGKIIKWRKILRKKYGKLKAKKMITVLALELLGCACPKKIRNPKTGNMIKFRYDISDALGILVAYLIENKIKYKFDIKWNLIP